MQGPLQPPTQAENTCITTHNNLRKTDAHITELDEHHFNNNK